MLMILGIAYLVFLAVSALVAFVVLSASIALLVPRSTRYIGIGTLLVALTGAILIGGISAFAFHLLARTQHFPFDLAVAWAGVGFAWFGLAAAFVLGSLKAAILILRRHSAA